jgi:tetratricopeptide (TPR) repeat protein
MAIKIGNFLPPQERNASTLYDSLLRAPELQPIAGHLRRRLAAAMLDDTQQALNAYLNTSANELARRQKRTEPYKRYALQLAKATELLGKQHMMSNTLEAKRLYFEGLELRIRSLAEKDSSVLAEAMEKQRAALRLEPEAAYIHNELGVVCINRNDTAEAKKQFLEAITYSPTRSFPYNTLSILALNAGDWQAANYYGIEAIRHAPNNPGGYANLGVVYAEKKDWTQAETLFRRAIRLDTERPVGYYNLACLEAKKGQNKVAIDWLLQAHEKGWNDFETLSKDEDLVSLHAMSEWKALMKKYYPDKIKE